MRTIRVMDEKGGWICNFYGNDLKVESIPYGSAYSKQPHSVKDGNRVIGGIGSHCNWLAVKS